MIQVKEVKTALIGDASFGSVKIVAAAVERDVEVVHQIKSNHSLFSKQFIEETLKDALRGCCIVLEGKHPSGADLVAIGRRNNFKVTLSFVTSKNARSARKGSLDEIKFSDSHSNVCIRLVDRPPAISNFFERSNVVDKHN